MISSHSSSYQRFGIYPEFNILLMSSRNSSETIWLSVNRKVADSLLFEHFFIKSLMKVLKESILYPFVISICSTLYELINELSLVNDCLPLPETPISKAFPRAMLRILWIFRIFSTASLKKTRFNLVSDSAL